MKRDSWWIYAMIIGVGITTVAGMVVKTGQLAGWW